MASCITRSDNTIAKSEQHYASRQIINFLVELIKFENAVTLSENAKWQKKTIYQQAE